MSSRSLRAVLLVCSVVASLVIGGLSMTLLASPSHAHGSSAKGGEPADPIWPPGPTPGPDEAVIFGVVQSGATGRFLDDVEVTAYSGDEPAASAQTYASAITYASALTYEGSGYQHGYFELYVPAGTYRLTFKPSSAHRNVLPAELDDVSVATGDVHSVSVVTLEAARGIGVEVRDATFSGPVAGATVQLRLGDGAPLTAVTDATGYAYFDHLSEEETYWVTVAKNGFVRASRSVFYDGDFQIARFALDADLGCEPDEANPQLTNMGFEDGLTGWTVGHESEGVAVVGADEFTSPWEGSAMARLGSTEPSSSEHQREGPNVLCQDFVATHASETLSFNVFTYDYTGYDQFKLDAAVVGEDGEVLASYEQGAWGVSGDTSLKTSGWRSITVDTSGHHGETLHLVIRAGGTRDNLYAFWVYLDSAASNPAPPVNTEVRASSSSGSVLQDPVTGQFTVAFPSSSVSDLTMTFPAACADDAVHPDSVDLVFGENSYPAAEVGSTGKYTATIPTSDIITSHGGVLAIQISCSSEPTHVTNLGQVVLYDPSGVVTDASTGDPVEGASVYLYKVPGWSARTSAGAPGPDECESNASRSGSTWTQAAPTGIGQLVSAASPEISPNANPFVTNADGSYGWDVAAGCWYVKVVADGYQDLVSPVVGVPTSVTDLDLQLTPTASGGGGGGGGGGGPSAVRNTAAPSITGMPKVGKTLTVDPGTWNPTDAAFAYQWLRDGTPVDGATGPAFALRPGDLGKAISVRVDATKPGMAEGAATSDAVTIVRGDAPSASVQPSITGARAVGAALHVSDGTWDADGLSFGYRWLRDGDPIEGATDASYTVTTADRGSHLSAVVTASRDGYEDGTATATPVSVPARRSVSSSTAAKLKRSTIQVGRHGRLIAVVTRSDGEAATGRIKVLIDGRRVVTRALNDHGRAWVGLPRLERGLHRLRASYAGSSSPQVEVHRSRSKVLRLRVVGTGPGHPHHGLPESRMQSLLESLS